VAGFGNVETWHTKEEFTGFLLGWEGCMAEDSQSFADAFKAVQSGKILDRKINDAVFYKDQKFCQNLTR